MDIEFIRIYLIVASLISLMGMMVVYGAMDLDETKGITHAIIGVSGTLTLTILHFALSPNDRVGTSMEYFIAALLAITPFLWHIVPRLLAQKSELEKALHQQKLDTDRRVAHYVNLGMQLREAETVVRSEKERESRNLLEEMRKLEA